MSTVASYLLSYTSTRADAMPTRTAQSWGRVLALRLRLASPLLSFTGLLLLGQLVAVLQWDWRVNLGALTLVSLWRARVGWELAVVPAAALLLGWVSYKCFEPSYHRALSADVSYLALVDDTPRHRRTGGVELSLTLLAEREEKGIWQALAPSARVLCRAVYVPWRNVASAGLGSYMAVRAIFKPLQSEELLDYDGVLLRRGYSATCKIIAVSTPAHAPESLKQRVLDRLTQRIHAVLGSGERSGLLLSMALGVRDVLTDRTETAFKNTGLAHLLVVSGCQVTLVFYGCSTVLTWLGRRCWRLAELIALDRWTFGLAYLVTLAFVWLVGFDGPSVRAALAALLAGSATLLGRSGGMWRGIVGSFLLLNLLWPGAALEPGVQLTYAALLGLYLGQLLCHGQVAQYLVGAWMASLFTASVSLLWFGQISWWGFLLNPIAAPLASFISCNLGLVAILLAFTPLDSSGLMLQAVAWTLGLIADGLCWLVY